MNCAVVSDLVNDATVSSFQALIVGVDVHISLQGMESWMQISLRNKLHVSYDWVKTKVKSVFAAEHVY